MMQKNWIVLFVIFIVLAGNSHAEMTLLKNKGYISIGMQGTKLDSKNTGIARAKIAMHLGESWSLGLSGSSFFHDNPQDKLVTDGTYHLYINYGGLFLEHRTKLGERWLVSAGISTGMGSAYYQYDKEFRKNKVWTEEIIDQTTFAVQEFYVTLDYRLYNNWWIGVNGTLCNTSPLGLIQTSDNLLKKANAGISIRYAF